MGLLFIQLAFLSSCFQRCLFRSPWGQRYLYPQPTAHSSLHIWWKWSWQGQCDGLKHSGDTGSVGESSLFLDGTHQEPIQPNYTGSKRRHDQQCHNRIFSWLLRVGKSVCILELRGGFVVLFCEKHLDMFAWQTSLPPGLDRSCLQVKKGDEAWR